MYCSFFFLSKSVNNACTQDGSCRVLTQNWGSRGDHVLANTIARILVQHKHSKKRLEI